MVRRVLEIAVLASAFAGCGSPPPPAVTSDAAPRAPAPRDEPSYGVTTEAEIGGMDETRVMLAFKSAAPKLGSCFNKGVAKLPYLAGEIRVALRVNLAGAVRWAFVKDSTLGDRRTEECMLEVLKSASWPKPKGGEGLAENSFTFEPGGDERPPVGWKPEQLGAPFKKAKAALAKCRSSASTGVMKATLYVDTDGKPTSIGVSSSDEKGEAAVGCVVSTLSGITFPSPGSYASKVSVTIE